MLHFCRHRLDISRPGPLVQSACGLTVVSLKFYWACMTTPSQIEDTVRNGYGGYGQGGELVPVSLLPAMYAMHLRDVCSSNFIFISLHPLKSHLGLRDLLP